MNREQTRVFHVIQWIIRLFTKPMKTIWSAGFNGGPAVFVCNHDSSYGPISMCVHFERYDEICPWINAQTLSVRQMPAYVRSDYWWPRDKWYTKILDYTLAYIVAPLLPIVTRGTGYIPVYHDSAVATTFRESVEALKDGKHILLFPERPTGYRLYSDKIYSGFVALGKLYHRRTGEALSFYPTFIDWKGKEIRVGEPLAYDPGTDYNEQAASISKAIEEYFCSKGQVRTSA